MLQSMNEYLPIGTVVTLRDGLKRMMIFGIIQTLHESDESSPGTEFDYVGVPYPEGNMGQEYQYMFNHQDIDTIYFRGYEDPERETFIRNLTEFYQNISDQEP